MKKIEYTEYGSIIANGVEWDIDGLKQVCHSDFVYEARNRGTICNKYKIPRELLNKWIETEDWVFDKKDHWQRPYSYRLDSAIKDLIKNTVELTEIQEEVDTIDFQPENLVSRVKVDIQFKSDNEFKSYKTFVVEKYIVKIEDYDNFTGEKIEFEDEIRYKCNMTKSEIILKQAKIQKHKGNKI